MTTIGFGDVSLARDTRRAREEVGHSCWEKLEEYSTNLIAGN